MIKNNFRSIKKSYSALFYKSLFIGLLVSNFSVSLQATEVNKSNVMTSLVTGVFVYLSSKTSVFKQDKNLDVIKVKHPDTKMLRSENEHCREDHEQLMHLFLVNHKLNSKEYNAHLSKKLLTLQPEHFTLDLGDYTSNLSKRKFSERAGLSLTKILSKISTLKWLATSWLLISSIPGVGAAKTDNVEFADRGAVACAACITGCCAALGLAEGPLCVIHCATTPICAWLCLTPLPRLKR